MSLNYLIFDLLPGTMHTPDAGAGVSVRAIGRPPRRRALADARKGIAMFRSEAIKVPVLGLVENMSYFEAPELPGRRYYIFGKEGGSRLAAESGTELLGQIPIVESICDGGDAGRPVALGDSLTGTAFMDLADTVVRQVELRNAGWPRRRGLRLSEPAAPVPGKPHFSCLFSNFDTIGGS